MTVLRTWYIPKAPSLRTYLLVQEFLLPKLHFQGPWKLHRADDWTPLALSFFIFKTCTEKSAERIQKSFRSVAQSCPTLCDPMDCSMPGLPVLHYLLEFAQIPVHRVSNAICHTLCCPRLLPSVFPSIRVFPNESVLCNSWPMYRSFNFIHQSQWIFRVNFL